MGPSASGQHSKDNRYHRLCAPGQVELSFPNGTSWPRYGSTPGTRDNETGRIHHHTFWDGGISAGPSDSQNVDPWREHSPLWRVQQGLGFNFQVQRSPIQLRVYLRPHKFVATGRSGQGLPGADHHFPTFQGRPLDSGRGLEHTFRYQYFAKRWNEGFHGSAPATNGLSGSRQGNGGMVGEIAAYALPGRLPHGNNTPCNVATSSDGYLPRNRLPLLQHSTSTTTGPMAPTPDVCYATWRSLCKELSAPTVCSEGCKRLQGRAGSSTIGSITHATEEDASNASS